VAATAARIGPNAIVQLANAMRVDEGEGGVTRLFRSAHLTRYLGHWPEAMVDETEVVRLHHTLWREWPADRSRRLSRDAGMRTGDYLLAHRIPGLLQWLLRRLPAAIAARILMRAILRHAWTFAGSGRFTACEVSDVSGHSYDARWALTIRGNPMCHGVPRREHPACDYYAATFERLFAALVHPHAQVIETACESCGDDACRFELGWP